MSRTIYWKDHPFPAVLQCTFVSNQVIIYVGVNLGTLFHYFGQCPILPLILHSFDYSSLKISNLHPLTLFLLRIIFAVVAFGISDLLVSFYMSTFKSGGILLGIELDLQTTLGRVNSCTKFFQSMNIVYNFSFLFSFL